MPIKILFKEIILKQFSATNDKDLTQENNTKIHLSAIFLKIVHLKKKIVIFFK